MTNAKLDALEAWQGQMIPFLEAQKPVVGGLPAHRLGCHWISDLYRRSDLDYMAALRPPVIKIVNPSRDRVAEAITRVDSNGHVALRYHPISEQHTELAQNPAILGRTHAQYWIDQLATTYKEFPRDRLYVMGLNEPSIHNAAEATRVAVYTENFLKTLQPHSIRAYVFNFSVGWPREENGRIIWDEFLYLEDLINATNSFGCTHEYGRPGLNDIWGKYGNRISHCPMKIKFVIGECGYTRQTLGLPQPWGWDGNISADSYSAMLWEYADKVSPGTVFAVLPFTTSYGGAEWQSKDTSKAHSAILARKHNFAWPNPWPQYATTEEPPVETDKKLIIFPQFTGKITGFYGQDYGTYPHEGMDLSTGTEKLLVAAYDGVVAYSGTDAAYGEYIRTYHPEINTCFFYAHLSKRLVQYMNTVKTGQPIGYTGATGNTGTPPAAHLHFEVRVMNPNGSYKVFKALPNTLQNLYRQNGRVDPLGWIEGWKALGGKVEER